MAVYDLSTDAKEDITLEWEIDKLVHPVNPFVPGPPAPPVPASVPLVACYVCGSVALQSEYMCKTCTERYSGR